MHGSEAGEDCCFLCKHEEQQKNNLADLLNIPLSLSCTDSSPTRLNSTVKFLEDPSHPFICRCACGRGSSTSWPLPTWPALCCSKSPYWGSLLHHSYQTSCSSQATGFVHPVQRGLLYGLEQPWLPFEGERLSTSYSPQPGGSRAARCVGCWRSSSPGSPPGGCGPAGRAAAPPQRPARRTPAGITLGVVPWQLSPPVQGKVCRPAPV